MTEDGDDVRTRVATRLRDLATRSEDLTVGRGAVSVSYVRARWHVVVDVKPPRQRDRVMTFASASLDAAVAEAWAKVPRW